ncbi:purple acid phosphatase family protein [Telluribacter humicola]|uniref:purple acid phosphatase family protein n=1 Tax=Telluribacter humicola TaxID=1720261 RepID=UPI001A966297|nr:metallophosphoesterase family protein [Telluribacter humicola]
MLPYKSVWKYAPESNTAPAASWKTAAFSDAGWESGQGAFGFGTHTYNTQLERGPGNSTPNYPAFYFRKTLSIADAGAYSGYRLRAFLDDGIVIYVNGVEVARKNMNPNPSDPYTRTAGDSLTIDTLLSASLFQSGSNLIAVEVHQVGETSSDLLFDLQLEGVTSGGALLPYKSVWKYAPESNTAPAASWKTAAFSDAGWESGQGAFGFGSHTYNTQLERGPGNSTPNYPAFYFRKTLSIADAGAYSGYRLRAFLDDGIVIYVNGVEVARKNMNPNPSDPYTRTAGDSLTIDTLLSASLFQSGSNLIAVEVHQVGETSSDLLFDLQLEGSTSVVSLFRYPYLQIAAHNRMEVWWNTTIPSTATVRYSTNSDLSSGFTEIYVSKVDTLHRVILKNLNPDTKYYYSVGYNSGNAFQQLQYNPAATFFRTLPDPTDTTHTMRFWLLGDSGASRPDNPRPYKVRDAYLAYLNSRNNPQVDGILFLGDNSNTVYEGYQPALDKTLFKFYGRPEDKQLLSYMPSWTVMGNHDYNHHGPYVHSDGLTYTIRKAYHNQTAASYTAFAFPDSAQIGGVPTYNKKGYYSFNQGDIHFVVLNPYLIEDLNKNDIWLQPSFSGTHEIFSKHSIAQDNTYDTPIDSLPQVKWLKEDLSANTKKWTIVTFHLPPFTTIGHFEHEHDIERVRERLLPILEKPEYRIDALLVSHSHAYLRAGMIRKTGTQPRKTDFVQSGNLGRYPASPPHIKTNAETAYTYLMLGSSGRGWYVSESQQDAGFNDADAGKVKHPSTSELPLDNLTGDNSTAFYHVTGGSIELLFRENRLDVKYIKELDASPNYFVADSFVVMKDVNKTTTLNTNAGAPITLRASWVGNYQWTSSASPNQPYLATSRTLTVSPTVTATYYVRDGFGHLQDTFQVNVLNQTVQSLKSGSWHDSTTWSCNCIPNQNQEVQINSSHTVTISTGDATLKKLIMSGGTLQFQNGHKIVY